MYNLALEIENKLLSLYPLLIMKMDNGLIIGSDELEKKNAVIGYQNKITKMDVI